MFRFLLSVGPVVAALGTFGAYDCSAEDDWKFSYQAAADLHNEGLYNLAMDEWKNLIANCPDAKIVSKARSYRALCCFIEKEYAEAVVELELVLKAHPAPKKQDELTSKLRRRSLPLLAATYRQLEKPELAKKTLKKFRAEFPADRELADKIERGEEIYQPATEQAPAVAAPPQ